MLAHCLLILRYYHQQSPSKAVMERAYHESLAQGIKPLLKRCIMIDRFLFAKRRAFILLSFLGQILIVLYQSRCLQERTLNVLYSLAIPRSLL